MPVSRQELTPNQPAVPRPSDEMYPSSYHPPEEGEADFSLDPEAGLLADGGEGADSGLISEQLYPGQL